MKNFVQPGNTITLAAPAAVTSGSGILVGAIFGIAAHDAASGEPVETVTAGVFDLNKVGSEAWSVGDKVYWDNTDKRATKVATDNTLIGVALSAVGSGANETTGRVRLNGSF
jgi:predicted RecA/RadA family phage recombinase